MNKLWKMWDHWRLLLRQILEHFVRYYYLLENLDSYLFLEGGIFTYLQSNTFNILYIYLKSLNRLKTRILNFISWIRSTECKKTKKNITKSQSIECLTFRFSYVNKIFPFVQLLRSWVFLTGGLVLCLHGGLSFVNGVHHGPNPKNYDQKLNDQSQGGRQSPPSIWDDKSMHRNIFAQISSTSIHCVDHTWGTDVGEISR